MWSDSYSDVEGRLGPVLKSRLQGSKLVQVEVDPVSSRLAEVYRLVTYCLYMTRRCTLHCASCRWREYCECGLFVSIFSIESLMTGSLAVLYVTKLHLVLLARRGFRKFGNRSTVSISTAAVYHVGTVKMYITGDFMRCVSAAIIYFVVSLVAVSKYMRGASKAATVLGFITRIVFAFDFYLIFNDLTKFLEKGEPTAETEAQKSDG